MEIVLNKKAIDPKSDFNRKNMETLHFNKLLLKTAFSCMACDGDIDKREVQLIKKLHQVNSTFGEIDIETEMEKLLLASIQMDITL